MATRPSSSWVTIPKFPVPAAQAPEQVGVLGPARHDELAVGGDDPRPGDVVGGEAERPPQPAEPATERVPDDADVRTRPRQAGQPEGVGRGDEIGPSGTGLDRCPTGPRVDANTAHPGGVDEHAPVAGGGDAVTGRHDADPEAAVGRVAHRRLDVRLGLGEGHDGRSLVRREVPAPAGVVVPVVAGSHQQQHVGSAGLEV